MQTRFGVLALRSACLSFVLCLGACDKTDAQTVALPEKLTLPTYGGTPLNGKARNLDVAVTATDNARRSPGQQGFEGTSPSGECRVYFNNVTPVVSDELYDRAFRHLDKVVKDAGGIEVFVKNTDLIPAAHIWADVKTPWRCVAGVIYDIQAAGFPTVGFIMRPNGGAQDSTTAPAQALYIDLPSPSPADTVELHRIEPVTNKIVVNAQKQILWNGEPVSAAELLANLAQARSQPFEPYLEFRPEPDASYDFVVQVLLVIPKLKDSTIDFAGAEKYRSFDKDRSGVDPTRRHSEL